MKLTFLFILTSIFSFNLFGSENDHPIIGVWHCEKHESPQIKELFITFNKDQTSEIKVVQTNGKAVKSQATFEIHAEQLKITPIDVPEAKSTIYSWNIKGKILTIIMKTNKGEIKTVLKKTL